MGQTSSDSSFVWALPIFPKLSLQRRAAMGQTSSDGSFVWALPIFPKLSLQRRAAMGQTSSDGSFVWALPISPKLSAAVGRDCEGRAHRGVGAHGNQIE